MMLERPGHDAPALATRDFFHKLFTAAARDAAEGDVGSCFVESLPDAPADAARRAGDHDG